MSEIQTMTVLADAEALADEIQKDPINALRQHIIEVGMAAQQDAFVMAILSEISAAAGCPFSILLAGNPASGKSTVASTTSAFVGDEFVVSSGSLNRMTAAAACRMAASLTNHCMVCDERASNSEFDSLWRQALSGQKASRIITSKGEPIELTIIPPISSVEAVLSDKEMSQQDRSRYLRIRMCEDEQSLQTIRSSARASFTLEGQRRRSRMKTLGFAYRYFLSSLRRDLLVDIPFAHLLSVDGDSAVAVRTEQHLLRAIQAVAWLRQANRTVHHDPDLGRYILATPEDYEVVRGILIRSGEDGTEDLSDNALYLFRRWKSSVLDKGNQSTSWYQLNQLSKSRLSRWQVYRSLTELRDVGLAEGVKSTWRLSELGLCTDRPSAFASLPPASTLADGGATLQVPAADQVNANPEGKLQTCKEDNS
ncbi:MAG: hypothetical protein QUV05_00455 [Phycisphaerae bacterium]|nr:hypothetical protein [Phycisphaerae bacterium]